MTLAGGTAAYLRCGKTQSQSRRSAVREEHHLSVEEGVVCQQLEAGRIDTEHFRACRT